MSKPSSSFTIVNRADCAGCNSVWHGRNAAELAEAHAEQSGHHVTVEVLTRTHWNERAMAPEVEAAVARARTVWREHGVVLGVSD